MFTSVLTAISSFQMILFSKHDEALFAIIKIIGVQSLVIRKAKTVSHRTKITS